MDETTARGLVREVLAGEDRRYAELVRGFEGPVYNLALRLTGSAADAADLAQETFLRAWLNLDKYDQEHKFFTWLYTLCLNLTRNHLKKAGRVAGFARVGPERAPIDETRAANPGPALAAKRAELEIQEVLGVLSVDHREALLLRYFQDVAYEDMAVILGISPSAAKMRVRRGLEAMRRVLGAGLLHPEQP